MFHWLSAYNYDFAIAAVPIQIILLLFYCSRRNLPIRSSSSFLWVMLANLTMTVSDLVSCEMNEIWTSFPLWVMYLINILYFLGFILRGWALFDYTASECNGYLAFGKWSQYLTAVPAAVAVCLILSTPWTATIFHFAPDRGYYNCEFYPIIYFSTYFYIFVSLLCVAVCFRRIDLRLKLSMLGYNAVLIIGIILRKQFINMLVTSYFSIIAVLVIYLSAQNPDLYRDKKTRLFNQDAFDRICSEFLLHQVDFHCILATAHNYESAKALYGSQQLNRSLEVVGRWMISAFPGYYVFYFGNADFLLLRKGRVEEHQEKILHKWQDRFARSWQAEDTEVFLSMSVMTLPGNLLPRDMGRIDDFVRFVYTRAYIENTRGNYIITEAMRTELSRREAVEVALTRALEQNRIEAYLQPIYSTREGCIIGAEALARLFDPEIGYIPPEEFIQVAEQTGDIMELGRQVFRKVCTMIREDQPQDWGIRRINVNLSPAQCRNDQLYAELHDIAREYQVSMDMIDFEITETSIEDNLMIVRQMERLSESGALFSLDDFGTGTSNLTRLMKLPIHVVKLDMNVVWAYFRGETKILPDLVRMFQNANMQIVVEGVETEEMKNALAEMGCDFEQGYYFSRPVPPKEFMEYMKTSQYV